MYNVARPRSTKILLFLFLARQIVGKRLAVGGEGDIFWQVSERKELGFERIIPRFQPTPDDFHFVED